MDKVRMTIGASLTSILIAASTAGASTNSLGPLTQVSGVSPFSGCTADQVSAQTGTNFPDTEVEPWVAVDPTNSDHVVALWQQDRWSNGGARGLAYSVSQDGGVSWSAVAGLPGVSDCTGGTFDRATDPWLSFAPNGDLYAATMSFNKTGGAAIYVSKWNGTTWDPPTLVQNNGGVDKETISADSYDATHAYAVWMQGTTTWFARTTNAGSSWEPARQIYNPGADRGNRAIGNQIVSLPGGRLLNLFVHMASKGDSVALTRSADQGSTWSSNAFKFQSHQAVGTVDPDDVRQPIRTGELLIDVAVSGEAVYAVWQDARFSSGRKNQRLDSAVFSMSTNAGQTWSSPIKVNKTPISPKLMNQQAFVPSVEVQSDGAVVVTYYDFRNNDADGIAGELETDHWAVHCHALCTSTGSWGDEVRLTDVSFDMRTTPISDGRGHFVGDYAGLATAGMTFMSLFSQSHSSDGGSVFFRSGT